MASSASDLLRLEKMANGENGSSWGTKSNTNLELLEDGIAGFSSIATTGGSTTLSATNYAADQSRCAILKATGTLTSNATFVIPSSSKTYTVWNATSGAFTLTVKTSGGTGYIVPQGAAYDLFCDGTDTYPVRPERNVLIAVDEKSSGEGGTFTASAWRTRDINTAIVNTISGASIASNQITLPSGTYRFRGSAPAYQVDAHQCKFYNASDSSDVEIGTTEWVGSTSGVQTRSFVDGEFTITAEKDFEVRHKCEDTQATYGFGVGDSGGITTDHYFTRVEIEKIK